MATGDRVRDLVAVMDQLRSPGGCPWDARQTHQSLVEYLIEETYEVIEAIEEQDALGLQEELGDLLLQVIFHARIAAESVDDPFDIDDVADGIVAKLIRRHPHVFAGESVDDASHVESNWQQMKQVEKGRTSVTEGIPAALPALVLANKLLSRSIELDLETPGSKTAESLLDKLDDERAFGDVLFALVAAGRLRGWDAETSLRAANRRFIDEIRRFEAERPVP